ncbi:MAG: tyrosine protein phosphatase, partial [Blastochloris sp.]|nr:tyrosine protein phosphatase [Blastochloris sp.]
MIHVCSLARLHDTVAACGARHVVTLINEATPVPRPASILESNHLLIGINDIVEDMPGFIARPR